MANLCILLRILSIIKDEVISGITTTKGLSHRIHAEKQQELKTELQWVDFDSAPPFGDA